MVLMFRRAISRISSAPLLLCGVPRWSGRREDVDWQLRRLRAEAPATAAIDAVRVRRLFGYAMAAVGVISVLIFAIRTGQGVGLSSLLPAIGVGLMLAASGLAMARPTPAWLVDERLYWLRGVRVVSIPRSDITAAASVGSRRYSMLWLRLRTPGHEEEIFVFYSSLSHRLT